MRVPHPIRGSPTLAHRLRAAATEHVPLKLAALFFSIVIWLVIGVREPTEALVPVRFVPLLDSSLTLRSALPGMRALVIGRGPELRKLYATPPVVRRVIGADAPDRMTIDLRPTDVVLPAEVEAIVADVQPRRVTLRFDSTLQRSLPVRSQLRFTADSGLAIEGAPRLEPESVTVIGDRRAVARLDSIATVASDLVVTARQPIVVPLDTTELGVRVRPAQVRVFVPVRRASAPPPPDEP